MRSKYLFIISIVFLLGLITLVNAETLTYTGTYWSFSGTDRDAHGIEANTTHVWLADPVNDTVYLYLKNGTYTGFSFDTSVSGAGDPEGITNNGTMHFVADSSAGRIYKYWINGTYTGNYTTANSSIRELAMNYDKSRIYGVSGVTKNITIYTNAGAYVGQVVTQDFASGGSHDVFGVHYENESDGNEYLWYTELTSSLVYKIFLNGTYANIYFNASTGTSPANSNPHGITSGDDCTYYINNPGTGVDGVFTYLSSEDRCQAILVNNYTNPTTQFELDSLLNGNFSLNVSNGTYTTINATFFYGGVEKTTYKVSGNNWTYFTALANDSFENDTDVGYYWNFTLVNSTGTFNHNQSYTLPVNSTVFTLCNASYTTTYLNFTFKDEASLAVINATIPSSTFTYWLSDSTLNKTYTFNNATANYYYQFCFSPTTRNVTTDMSLQYTSTGYPQRTYSPGALNFSNSTTNTTLYLLADADGLYVTFQVVNSVDQTLSGVVVTAIREVGGSDVIVAAGTTDDAGSVTFWLNPDYSHDFSFSKEGYTTFTSSFFPTQTAYTITLSGGTTQTDFDYSRGITYTINPKSGELLNDTAYSFNYTLSSSYWDVDEFGFVLKLQNGTVINSTSALTNGGVLNIVRNTGNYTRIVMEYYYVIDGNYTNSTVYWNVFNTANTEFSIKHFVDDLNAYIDSGIFGLDSFGKYVIVFLILFITIGVFSYKYGASNQIVLSALTFAVIFFFDVVLGFLPTPINAIPHSLTFLSLLVLIVIIIKEAQT